MKIVNKIEALHIVSEPGDGTRYDYFMIESNRGYYFFPAESTFKFPKFIIKGETDAEWLADEWGCNPWTAKECLRSIKEFESCQENQ